jgi:outer membrane biosynthesis protein TonB
MPARGFSRTGHGWQRVGGILFRPARVKLPLEVAALLLIVSLALYLTHRSSPPVSPVYVNVPASETQAIDPPRTEAVHADVTPELQTAAKPAPKPQHEPRAHFKPPMASVAPPRVVAEQPVPRNDETLSSADAVSESSRQAANEQMAASAQGTVEAPAANAQPSGEISAESSGKDKAPAAIGDRPRVIRELRAPPSDGTYFFLYSPSRKPL